MRIGLVGAFDRNNYGDLLMPIIMEKQINKNMPNINIEFEYYGLSYSNMEYTCAKNTKPLNDMYINPCDVIIVVGGEVLSASYTAMYLNLQSNMWKILKYKVLNRMFPRYTEQRSKQLLNMKSIKPWLIDKKNIKCKKIIYNTVGGNILEGISNPDDISDILNKIDYISIRERNSFDILKKYKNDVMLYPDSIINLSSYITDDEINSYISKEIKDNVNNLKEYFVFQIKNRYGKSNIEDIVKQIKKTMQDTGLNCILLPMGYAQGHEDHIVLNKICKKVQGNCYMPKFNNIYETIYVIKKSKLFAGTSLHGIITAISYNIPHIIIMKNLHKQNYFVNTWNTTPIANTSIEEMPYNVNKIIKNYAEFKENACKVNNRLKPLVEENFKNINKIIKECN